MASGFKYVVEGLIVPLISLFGLLGNLLTILVLNHREVKLKPSLVQILCGLATFDNVFLCFTFFMFTMPCLSESYSTEALPYIAPYLLPATNTLMTCSVYATVAVAINRFVEMSPTVSLPLWLDSGIAQSVIVFVFSVVFNASRWFELEFIYVEEEANETMADGSVEMVNRSVVSLKATDLRLSESYVRWYSLLVNSLVMNIAPTVIMIYCSYQVYRRLQQATANLSNLSSDVRLQARIKRNQSITRTLFGIIIMFIFCHTGKIVISIYEVIFVFVLGAGVHTEFEPWAKHLIVVNTLLVVLNSSVNFGFYCGDVVFRECLSAISRTAAWPCKGCLGGRGGIGGAGSRAGGDVGGVNNNQFRPSPSSAAADCGHRLLRPRQQHQQQQQQQPTTKTTTLLTTTAVVAHQQEHQTVVVDMDAQSKLLLGMETARGGFKEEPV